jgi:ectoine hydroxylase
MEVDPEVREYMLDRLDSTGASTRIALWNRAGDSVYGMAARCERMVDTMEEILGGPVYHFQNLFVGSMSQLVRYRLQLSVEL